MRNVLAVYLNLALVGAQMAALSAKAQAPAAISEDYVVDVWDAQAGLPDNKVTSIAQTPDGYLWVGTLHGGLARFDGIRFVNFNPVTTPELKLVEVHRLQVDPEGTLWIGFAKGELFSYRQGQFHCERREQEMTGATLASLVAWHPDRIVMSANNGFLYQADRQSGTNRWQTLVQRNVNDRSSFCEDREGVIWYRTAGAGLARFKDGRSERVTERRGLKGFQIRVVAKDAAGRVWVGTEKELAVWAGPKGFVTMTPTNGPAEITVEQLAFCRDGGVWVRTESRLSKCIGSRWVAEAQPWEGRFTPSSRFSLMFGDTLGGVWLAHYGGGLWHVDVAGQAVHIGEKEGLPSGLVECCLEDREGNIWAGLSVGGLVRVRKRAFHSVWPAGSFCLQAARSVCETADGAMWLGTTSDTFLEWRNGTFTAFTPPQLLNTAGRDGVVCPDAQGRLWAGTVANGVWLIEGGQFTRPFPSRAVGTVARALYSDQSGRFWIGNEFGLYCWQTNVLKQFSTNDDFAPGPVLSIAEGAPGDIWFGMQNAELRRLKNGHFTRWRMPRADSDIRFWALWPETNGVVWIGTLGAGLLRFQGGQFTLYMVEAGLPHPNISQIPG